MKTLKNQSNIDIQKIIGEAYLNISIEDKDIVNPLENIPEYLQNDPHLYITWLMSQPDYYWFLCREILNIDILPIQSVILKQLHQYKFPMLIMTRGGGKTFLLAVDALIRMITMPNRKIVLIGSVFRQAKLIFNYMEQIWNNAPLLRDLAGVGGGPKRSVDRWTFTINGSICTALPVGPGGQTIRGERAHDILCDEFGSQSPEVFETVISGFAAVSANPTEKVKRAAAKKQFEALGIEMIDDVESNEGNRIVIAGTAYYDFNHFYKYWRNWKNIIVGQDGDDSLDSNSQNYSVVRVPIELLPTGFMDEDNISRSKSTISDHIFQMEFASCFSRDSAGFYKRSLIEQCSVSSKNIIDLGDGPIMFHPMLIGNLNKRYVIAIDPATEIDNFSIAIIELNGNHRRLVYVWTTTKKSHREALKAGFVTENNFYAYCARKIRTLMKSFPTVGIALDNGGGIPVYEALRDTDKLENNEQPILPIINPDKPADTDMEVGLHLIHGINFADAEWVRNANHNLRFDFESKSLLFPFFDPLSIEMAEFDDTISGRKYDNLEECVSEIQELKDELAMIECTETANGRLRWDTPESKIGVGKKGRLRKDRYSALLMGNAVARLLESQNGTEGQYSGVGGFAGVIKNKPKNCDLYYGNSTFSKWAESAGYYKQ